MLNRMRTAVFFTAVLSASPLLAEDLTLDVVNRSSLDLHELYVSAHGADAWGEDILNSDVLKPGETGRITIADGKDVCNFDLRFITEDGNAIERKGVDLCKMSALRFND
jgi:hypothetical protein